MLYEKYKKKKMSKSCKNIIKEALSLAFRKDVDLSIISNYFSKNYEQFVDDKFINYTDFVKHLEKVRELTQELNIEFLQLIEENNVVFSRHKVTSIMLDGTVNVFVVFAEFQIDEDNKISKCIETTRLLIGNKEHENLGSDK